jgi:O-antigen/teichoic acid export membrane protein
MLVFSIFMLAMFLIISLFLDYFIAIIGKNYRSGLYIVPYLCIAYYLLGIFYNLSTWYKLTDKTYLASYVSITGAVATVISTYLLIPYFDILAGALGTIVGYGVMCLLSYIMGQKYYPVQYNLSKMLFYLLLALGLYAISQLWIQQLVNNEWIRILIHIAFIILFISIAYWLDIQNKIKPDNKIAHE